MSVEYMDGSVCVFREWELSGSAEPREVWVCLKSVGLGLGLVGG